MLPENQPPPVLLTLETSEDSIGEKFTVLSFLIEKEIKAGNYIWKSHKTDADKWPSPLHGHEYEKNLKLDAITGEIYEVATKARHATLKSKDLKYIQNELRASKDFKGPVTELIDKNITSTDPT